MDGAADPGRNAWAAALCRAINRQKKAPEPEEQRKARLTCDYEPDPRRGVLILRPSNVDDPWALVRARLARLAQSGSDAALLSEPGRGDRPGAAPGPANPAGSRPAAAQVPVEDPTTPHTEFTRQQRIEDLLGEAALSDPSSLQREAPGLLRVEDAVVFIHPEARP